MRFAKHVLAISCLIVVLGVVRPASAECYKVASSETQVCGQLLEILSGGVPVPIDASHPLQVTGGGGGSGGITDGTASSGASGSKILGKNTATGALAPVNLDSLGNVLTSANTIDPCPSSSVPKTRVKISLTSAGTTAIIPLVGSTTIYFCGGSVTLNQVATTANTFKIVYGTGTNCATGPQDVSGLFGDGGITAGPPITIPLPAFTLPAGTGACLVLATGGAISVQGYGYVVQQVAGTLP